MSQDLVPYQPGVGQALTILDRPDGIDFCRQIFEEVGVARADLTKIKVPGGGGSAFEVPTLGEPEYRRTMDCVIVYSKNRQRVWYARSLEESGGGTAPDCQSFDDIHGFGIRDIPEAIAAAEARENGEDPPEPRRYECGDGKSADSCPWKRWGSKRLGNGRTGSGQDCAEQAHLFFFHGKQLLPMLMVVPPTSVANWKAYRNGLAKYGTFPNQVITTIGLEPATSEGGIDYSRLTFKAERSLAEDQVTQFNMLGVLVRDAFKDYDPNREA